MDFKKKLCLAAVICSLSVYPVLAQEQEYTQEVLKGFVQQSRMTDLSPEYIDKIETLLLEELESRAYDKKKFAEAQKTADYLVNISKKYYGRRDKKTAKAYVERAELYTKYLIPDLAFKDLKKAEKAIKWNSDDKDLKKSVYSAYSGLYSSVNQPYLAIDYADKAEPENEISKAEAASKYRYVARLYSQAADNENSIKYLNNSIEIYKKDSNSNPFDLMGAYSELIDRSTYPETSELLEKHTDIANSFKPEVLGAKIDANLKRLQFYDKTFNLKNYKKLLDETAKEIEKEPDINREIAIVWLYISYYNQNYNPALLKKYQKIAEKFRGKPFDWNVLPSNSLKLSEKYLGEIYSNFDNLDKAEKSVNEALDFVEPVKKYVPSIYADFIMTSAQVQLAKGNLKNAENDLEKAEKILKKPEHEPVMQMVKLDNLYADFYKAKNDNQKALEYVNNSISKLKKLGGDSNNSLFDTYIKQADLYLALNDKEKAKESVDNYIKTAKAAYGENQVKTYDMMFNISDYCKKIDEDKAKALYNEVLSAVDTGKIDGVSNLMFYSVLITAAHDSVEEKDFVSAAKYAEKALKYANSDEHKYDAYDILMYSSYSNPKKRNLAGKYKKLRDNYKK